jgi:hypothetical protein
LSKYRHEIRHGSKKLFFGNKTYLPRGRPWGQIKKCLKVAG